MGVPDPVLFCPFCHHPMGVPRVEQIEAEAFTASLDCTRCTTTVTLQYPERTPAQAIQAVRQLWTPPTVAAAAWGRQRCSDA